MEVDWRNKCLYFVFSSNGDIGVWGGVWLRYANFCCWFRCEVDCLYAMLGSINHLGAWLCYTNW